MDLIPGYDCVVRLLNFLGTAVLFDRLSRLIAYESVMAEINGHSVSKVRAPLFLISARPALRFVQML